MKLLHAAYWKPEDVKACIGSFEDAMTMFEDEGNRKIAGVLFRKIEDGHGSEAGYEAEKEIGHMDMAHHGLRQRLDDAINMARGQSAVEVVKEFKAKLALREFHKQSQRFKGDHRDELAYIRHVTQCGLNVQKQFEAVPDLAFNFDSEVLSETMDSVTDIYDRGGDVGDLPGIRSGVQCLDSLLGPVQPGEVLLIAGRPGAGKSAMHYHYMHHAIMKMNEPCLAFNLELPLREQGMRLLSIECGVGQSIKNAVETLRTDGEVAFSRLARGVASLKGIPLCVVKEQSVTPGYFESVVRKAVQSLGVKHVFFDYMTLVTPGHNEKQDPMFFSLFAQRIKRLAVEMDLTMIVPCQLNRDCDRYKREPIMSDIRESGGIEAATDKAIAIWARPDDDGEYEGALMTLPDGKVVHRAKVLKNRQGEKNVICDMAFDGHAGKFYAMVQDTMGGVPNLPEEEGE